MSRHQPTYQCWQDMRQRCTNPRSKQYHNYGGRGIFVCKEWINSYSTFLADMGEKPNGLSIDRRDNNKGYDMNNCRWATAKEQRENQRTTINLELEGVVRTLRDWASSVNMSEMTLARRLKSGASLKDALTRPVNKAYRLNGIKGCNARWSAIAATKEES